MAKFLVHQALPPEADVLRDHLEPGAQMLADQLAGIEPVEVTWLWGCADLEHREWHMLYEAPDEATLTAFLDTFPGICSVRRVLYVHEGNLAWALVNGIADAKATRESDGDGDEGSGG